MAYTGSATDRLTAVQAAIAAILEGAQEYYLGGRRVRRANLGDLMKLEERLQSEVNSGTGESMTSLGVYGGVE